MLTLATFLFNAAANFALGLVVAYLLGAEEFGVFALVAAAAALLQTVAFEWLRLSANRFYGERQGAEDGGLIATLNLWTGGLSIGLSVCGVALFFTGGALGASALVAAMAPIIAIANGLFDFRATIARTCFRHRRYAALVLVKNVAALALMLGGAYIWRRADVVLVGLVLSSLSAVLISSRFYAERRALPRPARSDLARQFLRYAAPLVISSLLIQANMVLTRSGVALQFGIAESGRYSLALDIAVRLIGTIGSGLDLVLFQYAVRAEVERGVEAAKAQLSANIAMIVGVLLPACVGFWLALPGFEALFVAPEYRESFDRYTLLLLPGLFCFSVVFYVVNPLFQIARRTVPVIAAAAAGFAATAAWLFLAPGSDGGHGAVATSVGYAVNMVVMIAIAWKVAPVAVPWGDLAKIAAATIGMALAALPLHAMTPGPAALAATLLVGGGTYAVLALALNVGGLRTMMLARLRPARIAPAG